MGAGANAFNIAAGGPGGSGGVDPKIVILPKAAESLKPIQDLYKTFLPEGMKWVIFIAPEDMDKPTFDEFYNAPENEELRKMGGKWLFERMYNQNTGIAARLPKAQAYDIQPKGALDSVNDLGIIKTASATLTKQEIASLMTSNRVPPESFTNLPGTDEQWRTVFNVHELGHLTQPEDEGEKLAFEIEADQFMVNKLSGISPEYKDVTRAFMDMRAMSLGMFFTPEQSTHVTSAGVTSYDGDKAMPNPETHYAAFVSAQEKIYDRVMPMDNPYSPENAPLFFGTVASMYTGGVFTDPVEKRYVYEFLEGARRTAPDVFGVLPDQKPFATPEEIKPIPAMPAGITPAASAPGSKH